MQSPVPSTTSRRSSSTQKVGVTRQAISSIETGAYCPSALRAFRLAAVLAERVDRLFFLEGEPS